MRALVAGVAAAALALSPWACGPSDEASRPGGAGTAQLVDADGREVRVRVPVRRVVSLVPSATLTLDAIGAREAVVGRTDHDTASWTEDLPSVGGGIEPSVESIVAARPDLVIRFGGPQDVRTAARLDDLGVPHFAVRPDGIDDVLRIIRQLGKLTGHTAEADSLAASVARQLDEVRAAAKDMPPVSVAYVLGGEPPWVAGPGTYLDELIRLAGGTNAFSDLDALYAAVSPEEFVAREIDVVLLSRRGTFDRRLAGDARLVEVGDVLELPGPGVAEAAREVQRILRTSVR